MNWILSICLIAFQFNAIAKGGNAVLKLRLALEKEFPGIIINQLESKPGYKICWELIIRQKLDHWDPSSADFPQKIYIYHKSFKQPNVLVTEGYNIADRIYEPSLILEANQFSVEYRFFGDSKPDSIHWNLLNHKQALEDFHVIRKRLGKIYKKNWLITGISKGGTTASLYALTYPKDINASVVYVAPFVLQQEDPRTIDHYRNKVSTAECRKKVKVFQRNLLKHREEIVVKLKELEERDKVYFPMDKNKVIDFTAMEYPFSFWQWGFGCKEIPDSSANAQVIFDHIEEVVDFNYYDNNSCREFLPAYYQFMTEYGYYGFDTSGISDLLQYKHLSNLEFCPKDVDLSYNGAYMNAMYEKAIHKSKNTIFIYGGLDTWTSCAIQPSPETNVIKMVKYNGGHRTRIRDFDESDRQIMYSAIQKWMKGKIKPLAY
jgi:pimeloyl-ACP methyl ester carboxylesterase